MKKNLTIVDYLKAWALFFVCGNLSGAILGAGVGVLVGASFRALNFSGDSAKLVASIGAFAVAAPVSFLLFWWFVRYFIVRKMSEPPPANADARVA